MDLIAISGGENRVVIHRTVSWQKISSQELPSTAEQLCWSPDGRYLALGCASKIQIYGVEQGMIQDEESQVFEMEFDASIKCLKWAHVGKPHATWKLTEEEQEREQEWE